jgi:periplasmic divalent cation tolerance protein
MPQGNPPMGKPEIPGAAIVLTTAGDDDSAAKLARTLVDEGLAACVSRTPVRSVYRWEEGKPAREARVVDEAEVLLVIKTTSSKVAALEARILELHSYSCPEVVVLTPEHVEPRYLAWLLETCS